MLETAAELFDGKDDAGQRCVEGGGDTGCATGQQEVRELTRILEAEPAAEQQRQRGQQQLAGRHGRRKVGLPERCVRLVQGGNDLRNAAAACGLQHATGQPGQQREDARRGRRHHWPWRTGSPPALRPRHRPTARRGGARPRSGPAQ
ncbi:hypothetical protein G6F31_019357 [Rhizopus arrhizus]|nr:hypothetical protein G6F31_019357 [Rhizopus arrhizus]